MSIFAPLQTLADVITYQIFNMGQGQHITDATNYFIYDVLKIGLLLLVITHVMSVVRYYLPVDRIRDILTKHRFYGLDYLLAALLGVITPFCSCSSIPLFLGFLSAGIPLGVTITFLMASPLVNESSLYVFPAMFGWKVTILYNVLGIVLSVLAGMLIQRLHMERFIQPEILKLIATKRTQKTMDQEKLSWKEKITLWNAEAMQTTRIIFPYVILGVGVGALIHGYVPQDLIANSLSRDSLLSVPIATVLGIPLYANSIGVIPIIEALMEKGIPTGTAFAFMTATVTLSLPEALILKKLMRWQLLATFFAITTGAILFIGYLFNALSL